MRAIYGGVRIGHLHSFAGARSWESCKAPARIWRKSSRTAVGEFTLDHAVSLAELDEDAKAGKLDARVIRLENMLPDLPRATVLPIVEKRVRHGAKFNVPLAQIQPGHSVAAQGAPAQLDSGEWKPSRLRVFNQQGQLIAIAEPVVPRTYQPVVVLEATP